MVLYIVWNKAGWMSLRLYICGTLVDFNSFPSPLTVCYIMFFYYNNWLFFICWLSYIFSQLTDALHLHNYIRLVWILCNVKTQTVDSNFDFFPWSFYCVLYTICYNLRNNLQMIQILFLNSFYCYSLKHSNC